MDDFLFYYLYPLSEAKPETKYLLIKLLQDFGLNRIIGSKQAALADAYNLTNKAVNCGLKYLVEKNYLHKISDTEKQSWVGAPKGRPVCKYKFTKDFQDELSLLKSNELQNVPEQNLTYINCLLTGEFREKEVDKNKPAFLREVKLSTSNKLLLCILLHHADKFGVVKMLPTKRIYELTGIKKDGVKSQIRKLKQKGFIDKIISGGTNRHLFGRTSSVYFLNLLKFAGKCKKSNSDRKMTLWSSAISRYYKNDLALQIYFNSKEAGTTKNINAASPNLSLQEDDIKNISKCRGRFANCKTKAHVDFLEFKINDYASCLLSKYLHRVMSKELKDSFDITVVDNEQEIVELKNLIETELSLFKYKNKLNMLVTSVNVLENKDQQKIDQLERLIKRERHDKSLLDLIYSVSVALAKHMVKELNTFSRGDLNAENDFYIWPDGECIKIYSEAGPEH